jgi:alkaline phosphatase
MPLSLRFPARVFLLSALCLAQATEAPRARNVVLFIGDAGGIPTLHAASVYGHQHSQKLFIQSLPHIALMDTSAADSWVTDSAAAMTAIITGEKTRNGVLSLAADAERGKSNGHTLNTLLELAEQRGLSTGVITNVSFVDATPAACYAHVNERKSPVEIFQQLFAPRFGDGVDVAIGAGRKSLFEAFAKQGIDAQRLIEGKGYAFVPEPALIDGSRLRVLSLFDGKDFDPLPVISRVLAGLKKNPKGSFLMVEWDMHADDPIKGFDRALVMDKLIQQTVKEGVEDTLILFAADHSFNLRMKSGSKAEPLFTPAPAEGDKPAGLAAKGKLQIEGTHTGEQVLVAAIGPGSEAVHGFIDNTDLFRIMLAAYGWSAR